MPLFKSKNTKVKDNYRPISLLPFLSKINEKLTKTRAIEFLNENEILYNKQFGFRAGYSTYVVCGVTIRERMCDSLGQKTLYHHSFSRLFQSF